jgi:hypothetical protein
MNRIEHWAFARYDYIAGFGSGSITGIITLPHYLTSILFSIGLAFLTGIAGALGAHLVRIVFDKLKLKK